MKTLTFDELKDLPPLSEKEIKEAENFHNTDFSDCPKQTKEELAEYKPLKDLNPEEYKKLCNLYKPVKKEVHMRLDADILEWLKSQGKGYQTKINEILRNEMIKELSIPNA